LAWSNIEQGLKKISVNKKFSEDELNDHWEILAEAVQVYLRSGGDQAAYEKLKQLSQGENFDRKRYLKMLKKLDLDKEKKLKDLAPAKYLGLAKKLTQLIINLK